MASLLITNVSSETLFLRDIYKELDAGESVTVDRTSAQLQSMTGLHEMVTDGLVTVAYTRSADEIASGYDLPLVVAGDDMPAVASTDLASGVTLIRKSFAAAAAGTADDVTVYAANALPFKFRVLDAWMLVATNIASSTVTVRTQAAGAGTLLATLSANATGRVSTTAPTASALATPGASEGLFLRRSDRGAAGEVFLLVRKES